MTVNCLLTASSYPEYILAELIQQSLENSSHGGLTLSTGQSKCISVHPSLLCYLSPLVSSLLSAACSSSTIILPSSSATALPLVKQLLYKGQCQGTPGQVDDVSQLLSLLGLNMKIEIVPCSSDDGGRIAEDTLFLSCENTLERATASNENDRVMSDTFEVLGLPLNETYSQEQFTSIIVSAEDGFNTNTMDLNEMDCDTADILLSDEDVDTKSLVITELVLTDSYGKCRKKCYPCNQCKYKATQKSNLKRHIQVKHEENERKSPNVEEKICKDSDGSLNPINDVKIKCLLTKSNLKPDQFPCYQCDYIAKQNSHLKRHIGAKHSLERFECNLCEKNFSLREALYRHVLSIHENRSYSCPECHFASTRQESLKYHIQCKHSKETFTCDECGHQASTNRLIEKHKRRVHEGISYPCTKCEYQSSDKSSLMYHMMAKHEKIRYQCDVCTRKFTKKTSLKKHIIVKHSMKN